MINMSDNNKSKAGLLKAIDAILILNKILFIKWTNPKLPNPIYIIYRS